LEQRGPLIGVRAVQHGLVPGVCAEIDPRRLDVEVLGAVRPRDDVVPIGAIDRFELDLAGPLELGGILVPRPLALPEIEDAGRIDPFLGCLTPIPRRQPACAARASRPSTSRARLTYASAPFDLTS